VNFQKSFAISPPTSHLCIVSKLAEIQSAILQLDPPEREELRHWLDENADETPEMLAAIDEGLKSLRAKGVIPLEEVRRQIPRWTTGLD
jgi:hypothetical protein